MPQTLQNTSILERSNDTRRYIVWDGYSTVKLTWAQMTNRQRFYQLEAEARADYEVLFNIYSY